MIYIGVVIDIKGEDAETKLSALPFFTLFGKKGSQYLGVIELEDLKDWKIIEETFQNLEGFLGLTILSSFCQEPDSS